MRPPPRKQSSCSNDDFLSSGFRLCLALLPVNVLPGTFTLCVAGMNQQAKIGAVGHPLFPDDTDRASRGASRERCIGHERHGNLPIAFCRLPGISLPGQHRLSASQQNRFINE
jgi:hypothetical protein